MDTQHTGGAPISSYSYSLSTETISITPTTTPTFTRNVRRVLSTDSSAFPPPSPAVQKREESRLQAREFILQMLIGNRSL